ncbi:MAG: MFS transporter [Candidatus Melainabacteria bacterium]|nr:MFS transporter [Candidatus Melainabacteria bacterium]
MHKDHKKVLLATWLGWVFDGMDSSLYPFVANQALGELIGKTNPEFGWIAAKVLAIFLLGWSAGGFLFGYLGDKIGRAKALSISVLAYAVFTGLSGLAHSWQELSIFRFLSGLGIGGEWALGVALLAESIKPEKRIMSTAFLATGFSVGCCLAVLANFLISPYGWRIVFLFGILPALLVFYIRKNIKEPTAWLSITKRINNPFGIFSKKYSYNKLWIAFLLGVTFSIGSWTCILFWFPIWVERTLGGNLYEKTLVMLVSLLAHIAGSYLSGPLLMTYKRKTVLFSSYLLTFITSLFMYSFFHAYGPGVLIFASLLGFFFGIIPGSFAIYFPELFPTKIRSTAKGFCYSTARVFTAFGALYSGYLVQVFNGNIGAAGTLMSFIFLIGAMISLFAPETDKILPT